jgi:hypothetical protein
MPTTNSHNGDTEKKVAKMQNQKAARFIVLMVAAMGILQAQRPLSRLLHGRSTASTATTVAVFALMPIARKIWPLEGEKPFTAWTWVIWAIWLGALGLGLTLIDAPPPFLSSWFNAHPVFAALDSAAGGWLLPGAMLLICGFIFLLKGKARQDQASGQ